MTVLRIVIAVVAVLLPAAAWAEEITFGAAALDRLPPGFETALTGGGGPVKWEVVADPGAEGGKALAQISQDQTDDRFPLAIYTPVLARDIEISIRFRTVSGKVDQAAGIAFRLKDRDNYYVVRANALEDNVRLYHVVKGVRRQIAGAAPKVAPGVWHTLAVRAAGQHIEVDFDNRTVTGTSKSMTVSDAARIQSATAKATGGNVAKGSFPARAMSAATKTAK